MAVAVWHSVPGTVLLYGAVVLHVALALQSLYRRRTLRMPPVEVLRIALGLGIPILLIGHAVSTRLAWEAYRVSPDYNRVVWSLWTSDSQGRQLALLVPGWLHGCLGVNFAFARREAYRRIRPVLFALALLLPVVAALGFLSMGKELAADVAHRELLDSSLEVDPATRIALARIRDGALAAWFALIGGVFVAREVRGYVERRRNAVITIAYPQRRARVPAGWSVLEASRSHHIAHLSMCGGQGRCSTCRIAIVAGEDRCPPPGDAEMATLTRVGAPRGVRLACQLRPTGDIAVVPLLAAAAQPSLALLQDRSLRVVERDVAIVRAVWQNRTAFVHGHLPQDVVYLTQLFVESAQATLRASGGMQSVPGRQSVSAIFGVEGADGDTSASAVAAVAQLDRVLETLARRYVGEFGAHARFVVLAHAGAGAIGGAPVSGSGVVIAAGEVVDTLDALEGAADVMAGRILLSATIADAAGLDGRAARPVRSGGQDPRASVQVVSFSGADALDDARVAEVGAGRRT